MWTSQLAEELPVPYNQYNTPARPRSPKAKASQAVHSATKSVIARKLQVRALEALENLVCDVSKDVNRHEDLGVRCLGAGSTAA